MSYRNFRFKTLKEKFNIQQGKARLFPTLPPPVLPSNLLNEYLRGSLEMMLSSEKAVSEGIVFPMLKEIWDRNRDKIELYSGEMLDADPAQGLNGKCDFIFSKAPGQIEITAPIFCITEAKKGDIEDASALAQTAAQLVGAKILNKNAEQSLKILYGACTNGKQWVFMKLEGDTLTLDSDRYFLNDLPQLLGTLQHIVANA